MFWGLQSRSGLFDKEEHTIAHPLCTSTIHCFLDGKPLNKSLQCFFPLFLWCSRPKKICIKWNVLIMYVFAHRRVHSCMWYPPNREKNGFPKGHIVMLSSNTDTLGFRGRQILMLWGVWTCKSLMLWVSQLLNTGALGSELKASDFDKLWLKYQLFSQIGP